MPLTVGTSTAVNDLAAALTQRLTDRSGGRESISNHTIAFDWTSGGPSVLARYVSSSTIDGLSFTAVRVGASGTPAGKVAERAQKNLGTTLTTLEVQLAKYAGLSVFSTEQALSTIALMPALTNALFSQALLAYDVDSVAALAADHGPEVTGTTWSSAILAGVAAVISAGGNPDLLVMSGVDYAAAIESPGSGYVLSPIDAVPSLYGCRIAVCVGATAGTAYVADSKAITSVDHASTPGVILDPYSSLSTNEVRLAAEFFAATVVVNPGSVAEVTVTVARSSKS
jgi:hypothetical protein